MDNVLAYDAAVQNANRFSGTVKASLLNTLSHTQAWIAISRNGRWIVAPVKFAGHVPDGGTMSPELYDQHRTKLSGTQASGRIGEIFGDWNEAPKSHPARAAIRSIAQSMGKDLRADCGVYVLNGEALPDNERQMVESLEALITSQNLSEDALASLAGRIAA